MHKRGRLPRTSRINEKIMEYYLKYGQERDLEKFMRLYSPSGSHCHSRSRSRSRSTTTTTTTSENGQDMRRLFLQESSSSGYIISSSSGSLLESGAAAASNNEHIIPITVEDADASSQKDEPTTAEDLRTPKKTQRTETKQTQTPESVAKSHRRLEWDSLGDVGYKKSVSTGNISVLERSLLKEFFQEGTTHKANTNASEGDLKELQVEIQKEYRLKIKSPTHQKYNTPPLASSTFVDPKAATGTKPKFSTKATSTSLHKQFEKSAQTSIQRIDTKTREVQANMSSASSVLGSSATPSSFDYYSSRSSLTNESKQKSTSRRTEPADPHPFVAGITELISSRKALAEKQPNAAGNEASDFAKLQELHDTLKQALNENKENSSSSTLVHSPQLSLGIQLLCSLIEAKSLTHRQKKKLVRDIVRRITHMSGHETLSPNPSAADSRPRSTKKKHNSLDMKDLASSLPRPKDLEPVVSSWASSEQKIHVEVYKKPSPPTTSARALEKLKWEKCRSSVTEGTTTSAGTVNVINRENVPKVTASAEASEVVHSLIEKDLSIGTDATQATTSAKTTARDTQKSRSSHSSSSSGSSSKDVTTQKPAAGAVDDDAANTDAEQATMREWLNPMTLSEIEYEEKKREFARNAAKREKLVRKMNESANSGHTEREVQLSWIENEIQRLESLRHLLIKEDAKSTAGTPPHKLEKLYDTVFSEEHTDEKRQEIEVIIEESQEDVVNLEDNLKRNKSRKRETQVLYDKSTTALGPATEPRFRTVKETITTQEEQVLPGSAKTTATKSTATPRPVQQAKVTAPPPVQRSKIDTPPSSASNESESVCSFVQQRKREFIKAYKDKKKIHYETLLHTQQQQQELLLQQHQQILRQLQQQQRRLAAQHDQYSEPHAMQRGCTTYPHMHVHGRYSQPQHYVPPAPPPPPHCNHRPAMPGVNMRKSASAGLTSHTASAEQHTIGKSSSSLLCASSEVSVPMGGSNDTSSTPTTTHQYDDVAAVGVQTRDSLRRSQPIFGPRPNCQTYWRSEQAGQSTGIQVRPKGIAYIINFDDKAPSSEENTSASHESLANGRRATGAAPPQPQLTLQDHLRLAKPRFLAQSKERKAILNQIQALRQEREREMRDIVDDNTSITSIDRKLHRLPPPPTKRLRIFQTSEMKAMTNKHVANLPEVLERQQQDREERQRRGNRVLRDVFNRRLQKRVRVGKLSMNHSRTVI